MKKGDIGRGKRACRTPECRGIMPLLYDYACAAGGTGTRHRGMVEKHLAACPACRMSVADIKSVVRVLRRVSTAAKNAPARLSPDRRRQLFEDLAQSQD